jgi:hypothetical protein
MLPETVFHLAMHYFWRMEKKEETLMVIELCCVEHWCCFRSR